MLKRWLYTSICLLAAVTACGCGNGTGTTSTNSLADGGVPGVKPKPVFKGMDTGYEGTGK